MFHDYPPWGVSIDANDSTGFSSDTDNTASVISPNARIKILSQFVPRVDSLSEYWKWTHSSLFQHLMYSLISKLSTLSNDRIRGTTHSENARHLLVWVYHEWCVDL